MILLASVCTVTLKSQNFFCTRTWYSNQSEGGAILALSSFLNEIPHQKEPEILVGVFSSQPLPTTTTVRLISFLCMTGTVAET